MHLPPTAPTRTPLPYTCAGTVCVLGFGVLRRRRAYAERDIANAFPDARVWVACGPAWVPR